MQWRPALRVTSAGAIAIGSGLPWIQSGSTTRSSYTLMATVRRLGLVEGSFPRAVLALWPVVPMLSAVVIAATLVQFRTTSLLTGCVLAVVAGAMAGVVMGAPVTSLIGTRVALAGSLGIVLSGIPSREGKFT